VSSYSESLRLRGAARESRGRVAASSSRTAWATNEAQSAKRRGSLKIASPRINEPVRSDSVIVSIAILSSCFTVAWMRLEGVGVDGFAALGFIAGAFSC